MEVSKALELVYDYEENRRGSTSTMVADSSIREEGVTPMAEPSLPEVSPGS